VGRDSITAANQGFIAAKPKW